MLSSTLVNINVFYKIRGHYQKISFCSPFFEIRKAKRTARSKKWGLMTKNGVFLKKKPKKRNFSRKKLDKSHFTLYVM